MIGNGGINQYVGIESVHRSGNQRADLLAVTFAMSSCARSAVSTGASLSRVAEPGGSGLNEKAAQTGCLRQGSIGPPNPQL